jgi:hypothetical protein
MKRPLALTIVGVAWFLFALVGVLSDTVRQGGVQIPSTTWFYFFVAAGLLSGWRWSRWYALLAAGAGFVMALCFAPWMLMHPERLVIHFPTILLEDRPHETVSMLAVVLVMFVYLVVSAWSFVVLMQHDVKEFFAPRAQKVLN